MSRSRPRSRSSPITAAVAAIVVVLAVAAACSGGGDAGGSSNAGARSDTGESAAAADDVRTTLPPLTTAAPTSATAPATTTAPPATGEEPDACAEVRSWGTEPLGADTMTAQDVYLVRPGRHDCYDRVVFDVNGVVAGPDSVGFHVAYAGGGEVAADGSGEPVPTAGGAALEVVVRAPALGYGTSGHQPGRLLGRVGDDLVPPAEVASWPALREVTFAGSFEGQTTFAVGVDRRLPFRAGAFESDGYTRVYVDIAHP